MPESQSSTIGPPQSTPEQHDLVRQDLTAAIAAFQRDQAPLVREELARLAREGQRPTRLFLACSDSRLVTSMITASRPGDAFTVRNVGNLVPPPAPDGVETACDSVAAAIEYAVDVLRVHSITVCGHSGCGAMQALLAAAPPPPAAGAASPTSSATPTAPPPPTPAFPSTSPRSPGGQAAASPAASPQDPGGPTTEVAGAAPGGGGTPLARWLRHGKPSLSRLVAPAELLAERAVEDEVERLCLVNVVQQLEHLMAHPCVARGVAAGEVRLQGMYFHVAEAQGYVLDEASGRFTAVRPRPAASLRGGQRPGHGRPAPAPGRWGQQV